jgi:hypothetical protein
VGEARRKLEAALASDAFPGGPRRCPRCLGLRVGVADQNVAKFYAPKIAICGDCRAAWEPIDEALIWDRTDRHCAFSAPCDNCAFRPGSSEQADRAKWRALIANLKAGASFHCHKGVPLAPGGETGFAYPRDRRELRHCRGYLDALGKWLDWGGKVTGEQIADAKEV